MKNKISVSIMKFLIVALFAITLGAVTTWNYSMTAIAATEEAEDGDDENIDAESASDNEAVSDNESASEDSVSTNGETNPDQALLIVILAGGLLIIVAVVITVVTSVVSSVASVVTDDEDE